jgi:hypothetical protein
MKNNTFQYLEKISNKTFILALAAIIIFLVIISSAWNFPYGQDANYNIAQISAKDFLSRPVHGLMNILGVIFYTITNIFGGDVYFSFNILNIICSLVFVISIYFVILKRTDSKIISFFTSLAIFAIPNIWWMMTTFAYYSTAFAFLALSVLLFLKGTKKYLILSGICLGLSLMSNPAIIFISPLYLLLNNEPLRNRIKPVVITIGFSILTLFAWIAFTFNSYLLSGPWNVKGVVSAQISQASRWLSPTNTVFMLLYAFVVNYHLFLPFILICFILIYKKEKSVVVIALITLFLNYYFWFRTYGRYLMPYIALLTIVLITYYVQHYPMKRKLVSALLILFAITNLAIGIFGYSIASKDINKKYIDLIHYIINNNRDKNLELVAWGDGVSYINYFYPETKTINLDEYFGHWDELNKELETNRNYYYIPNTDFPLKAVIRNMVSDSILERANKIPKDPLLIFIKYDSGNNLKIQTLNYNDFNYYIITKIEADKH